MAKKTTTKKPAAKKTSKPKAITPKSTARLATKLKTALAKAKKTIPPIAAVDVSPKPETAKLKKELATPVRREFKQYSHRKFNMYHDPSAERSVQWELKTPDDKKVIGHARSWRHAKDIIDAYIDKNPSVAASPVQKEAAPKKGEPQAKKSKTPVKVPATSAHRSAPVRRAAKKSR